MITEKPVDRRYEQDEKAQAEKVREGRRRALLSISRCCVVVTDDGREIREVIFDQPPTVGMLATRVGPDVWVVSVTVRRVPRGKRRATPEAGNRFEKP